VRSRVHADAEANDPEAVCSTQRLNGLRSYRVGVYRIIYEFRDDRSVRVVAIRHRSSPDETDPR
jgi:mRNA-degrading endonuclease RelE of RelBE toxin-antitoxin system